MSNNNDDLELEEQLAMLGVDLGNGVNVKAPEPVQQVVKPTQNTIPQPFTPENPLNTGVVTNSVIPQPNLGVEGVNTDGLNEEVVNSQESLYKVEMTQSAVKPQGVVQNTENYAQRQVQNTLQQQVNQQAQAQVVHTTTTAGNPISQPVQPVAPAPQKENNEVVFLDLARAVNSQKTPWLRLKDNEWSRVLFLGLDKIIPIKCHYIKGLGYVKCLSRVDDNGYSLLDGDCCSKYDPSTGKRVQRIDDYGNSVKPKNRYLVPVIEYPVDKANANKLIPGQNPQIKMWNMNAVEWGDLVEGIQAIADDPDDLSTADLTNIDFLLHKDASGQFKTTSVKASPKCYRNDFAAVVQSEAAKFTKDFYMTALKESMKNVSPETIINAYDREEAENRMVNNMIQNNTMGNQDLDI